MQYFDKRTLYILNKIDDDLFRVTKLSKAVVEVNSKLVKDFSGETVLPSNRCWVGFSDVGSFDPVTGIKKHWVASHDFTPINANATWSVNYSDYLVYTEHNLSSTLSLDELGFGKYSQILLFKEHLQGSLAQQGVMMWA